jgi:hypothetical protein
MLTKRIIARESERQREECLNLGKKGGTDRQRRELGATFELSPQIMPGSMQRNARGKQHTMVKFSGEKQITISECRLISIQQI